MEVYGHIDGRTVVNVDNDPFVLMNPDFRSGRLLIDQKHLLGKSIRRGCFPSDVELVFLVRYMIVVHAIVFSLGQGPNQGAQEGEKKKERSEGRHLDKTPGGACGLSVVEVIVIQESDLSPS